MDHSIGKLMEYIDQAGIRDDTVVVFSSDNGYDYQSTDLNIILSHF